MSSSTTKKAIAYAFKELLLEKPITKITVQDISERCEINRQTFYYHFKDIYDLLEWIFTNEVVKKIEKETTIKNWQENFKYVLDYMLENKKFIIKTYNSLSRKTLLDFLFKQYNTIFIDIINDVSKNYNITKENKIFIANFYKYGFVGVMLDWIDSGMDEDYQMILDDLEMTVLGTIDLSIQNFTNRKK